MQNQSFFSASFIAPTLRKQVENVLVFNKSKLRYKTFFCAPNKIEGNSMISYLKQKLGIKVGAVATFNTDFISSKVNTLYNGNRLTLRVNNDIVELIISDGMHRSTIDAWKISQITNILSIKNQSCNFINDENIKQLIIDGRLIVRFNVSAIKDHGTIWKIV